MMDQDLRSRLSGTARFSFPLALFLLVGGCGDGDSALGPEGARLELTVSGLHALDPETEGVYEAWVVDSRGRPRSAGRFQPGTDGRVELESPVAGGRAFQISVEPPGDTDAAPSEQMILGGSVSGGSAELRLEDVVTAAALPLRENPGQYTVFTPSDNSKNYYPSNEHSGIWLFNSAPRETEQGDQWVRLTPLRDGWIYEGWMVRDLGEPDEIWLSYGKFRPSRDGAVNHKDDTGWGPFSGVEDYHDSRLEDFPGDDWISNPLGFPFPEELDLPVDLREKNENGEYRWTHVISIEPAWNQGEPVSRERPFLLQPYRDRFIDNGIGRPRSITFRPETLPSARVEVR